MFLCRSGIEQNNIQIFYDYLVNDLLAKHFLTGADKQSTFGVICKRESHITLIDDTQPNQSQIFAKMPNHAETMNTSASNSNDADNTSFMTASSTTIEDNQAVEDNTSKKFHMLIYKAEQTYLTLLIPGKIFLRTCKTW